MRKQELHPRTAVINNSQRNLSKRARVEALSWLSTRFPEAFDNSLRIRPLKTGIMDDILLFANEAQEAGISKSKLREAVVLFTRRIDYLTCLKAQEMRIDLQGQIVGEVTLEESEHAAVKIKRRVEKSLRNSKKILAEKAVIQPYNSKSLLRHRTTAVNSSMSSEDYLPIYPSRAPAYGVQNTNTHPAKVPSVTIKNKSTKPYDPDAVARLKERLGLTRKKETSE